MEARLHPRNVLIALDTTTKPSVALEALCANFAGVVVTSALQALPPVDEGYWLYVVGDVRASCAALGVDSGTVLAVDGASTNNDRCSVVRLGEVPIRIPGIGVLYPQFFREEDRLYDCLTAAHTFQPLQEGNKPGISYRKGIYITHVEETAKGCEFNLLRCSTNLGGPTDDCRSDDYAILSAVNDLRMQTFEDSAELNHVLAQEYHNVVSEETGKMKKASISTHSDKTKDMPRNATIAFATFYSWKGEDPSCVSTDADNFDLLYKGKTSVYTRLDWRLKEGVEPSEDKPAKVSVTLPPGSVLLISLSANREYTHCTRPSVLPIDKIPTRLSYVMRSSKTVAVHRADGTTCIKAADGTLTQMRAPTKDDLDDLRAKYALENSTADVINYGPLVPYSMNAGDYLRPLLCSSP